MGTHAADHRSQVATLAEADAWGEMWTTEDLDFVRAFANERDEDLAKALGRTLYAVRAARQIDAKRDERRARTVSGAHLPSATLTITSYADWEASFANA
jgi:hypothetical protein